MNRGCVALVLACCMHLFSSHLLVQEWQLYSSNSTPVTRSSTQWPSARWRKLQLRHQPRRPWRRWRQRRHKSERLCWGRSVSILDHCIRLQLELWGFVHRYQVAWWQGLKYKGTRMTCIWHYVWHYLIIHGRCFLCLVTIACFFLLAGQYQPVLLSPISLFTRKILSGA